MLPILLYSLCCAFGAIGFYTLRGNKLKDTIKYQQGVINLYVDDNKRLTDAIHDAEYTHNIKIID